MRRVFKWLGIGTAAVAALSYLTLGGPLTLILLIKLAGIPPTLFSQFFPDVYYDHVEAILEIDGERVVVHGTARCSVVTGYILASSPKQTSTTRTGGAAASMMSDGRAVVVPYWDVDYCRPPGTAGKMSDRPAGIYRDWNKVFDQRFPLNGNINVLIMNDGNNPTEMDLLIGPGYFRNSGASVKLVSAYRWRASRGRASTTELHWVATGRGLERTSSESERWAGIYAYAIATDPPNPITEQIQNIIGAADERQLRRAKRAFRELVVLDDTVDAWAVRQNGLIFDFATVAEPFRIPLVHLNPEGRIDEVRVEHATLARSGCYSGGVQLQSPAEMVFRRAGSTIEITPIPAAPFLQEEVGGQTFHYVKTVCVAPANFLNAK